MLSNKKKILIVVLIIVIILGIMFFPKREIFVKDNGALKVEKDKKKDKNGVKTKGWLRIQGTNIDHPVIYYEDDNSKYINRDKYLWDTNANEELYNHVAITGHNILNLSSKPRINDDSFNYAEDLMSFIYPEFIEKNKYMQYTINNREYIYKIYAVRLVKDNDSDLIYNANVSEDEIVAYADRAKNNSIYKTNVNIKPYDGLISVITCTRLFGSEHRSILVGEGRMVRAGEKLVNYSVKKTDNYNKLKKYMKGDVNDV